MPSNTIPIRVLIAEDSPVERELLVTILQSVPGFQVVGAAHNGAEAVRLVRRLKPDVITMDVHMPEMDGLEATRRIMAELPCPIVIVSSSVNRRERNLSFDALQVGALTVLHKPTIYDPPEVYAALTNQIRLMAEVKVVRRWGETVPRRREPQPPLKQPILKSKRRSKIQLIAMTASTGGPGVLAKILSELPADFPAPILTVQHIAPHFSRGLADWLNQRTHLAVRLARHADEPTAGQVLIAPDNYHMLVNHLGLIALSQAPPQFGVRPAGDYLFDSVARVYGATAIGVILSGMGSDGARGLCAMREMGAHTIAQDEATCVVFGMPAVAIELGAVEQILPTDRIAPALLELIS